jgi:DNA-binding XRE family transcriptional regulator
MSGYREDRRIDAVRRLGAVTKNEAAEMTDISREHTLELEREKLAAEYKAAHEKPKRSFADLVKRKP